MNIYLVQIVSDSNGNVEGELTVVNAGQLASTDHTCFGLDFESVPGRQQQQH